MMDGILPVNKRAGMTSYDVIRRVKKILPRGIKIGHAGTLDPFAEGVLLLLLGKGTKKFDEIQTWKKQYRAEAKLGWSSDTLDVTGTLTRKHLDKRLRIEQIRQATGGFVGKIEQAIPAYAAAKFQGRKLYEYAREGKEVPEKSKNVTVYSIKVLGENNYHYSNNSSVIMRVVCGSGTYIRQLSYDLLRFLGVESYLTGLVREAVGRVELSDCVTLEQLETLDTQGISERLVRGGSDERAEIGAVEREIGRVSF